MRFRVTARWAEEGKGMRKRTNIVRAANLSELMDSDDLPLGPDQKADVDPDKVTYLSFEVKRV